VEVAVVFSSLRLIGLFHRYQGIRMGDSAQRQQHDRRAERDPVSLRASAVADSGIPVSGWCRVVANVHALILV
jgi:hypothetical protein